MTTTFRTHDGRTLEQAASDLVHREVLCCVSYLVSTIANDMNGHNRAGEQLFYAALELAAPVLDYEEAAREAGWTYIVDGPEDGGYWSHDEWDIVSGAAEDVCLKHCIEPHELEVYEHWAVSTWLAEKLQAAGERVDTDFAGLCVWARTTTGQAISIDAVIERITREMHAAR